MNTNTGGKLRKRGQRKNSLDIPQRFLDRLSPSVLETSRVAQDERASVSPEILTLEGLFKRYYRILYFFHTSVCRPIINCN
ncbi:hypothetical protein ACWGXJ_00470 [Paenibacillus sp. S33]|uniref:hypothetical protein n=1 Tax=Paenibacillus TaxID=44249 RepID=UPI00077CB60A|nr:MULTISPECIES: hypothetical protein [Paenibacillus]KYG92930.1 hypothetical protein AZE31_03525 [Paenibacillus polymyxa]MCP3781656.1 hypothetical protein [Paenibacillus sp. MZ03-122A]